MRPVAALRALLYGAVAAGCAAFADAPRAFALAQVWPAFHSLPVLGFATVAAACVALLLVETSARRTGTPALALAATALCAMTWLDVLRAGADLSPILFFAALCFALEARTTAGMIAATAIALAWCNLSPFGLLAPLVALANLLGTLADRAETKLQRGAALATAGAALAVVANPHGWHYPEFAWRALDLDNAMSAVYSNVPVATAPLGYRYGFFAVVATALFVGTRVDRWSQTFVFLLAVVGGLASGALVPFAGIAATPLLAGGAKRLFAGATSGSPVSLDARPALATAAFAAALGALLVPWRVPASIAALDPYSLLAGLPKNTVLACASVVTCDVAERVDGFAVVADAGVATAPLGTINAQRAIARGERDWRKTLRERRVTAALVGPKSAIATLLGMDGWTARGTTPSATLFVRRGAP